MFMQNTPNQACYKIRAVVHIVHTCMKSDQLAALLE
jgi:hypothetical protein